MFNSKEVDAVSVNRAAFCAIWTTPSTGVTKFNRDDMMKRAGFHNMFSAVGDFITADRLWREALIDNPHMNINGNFATNGIAKAAISNLQHYVEGRLCLALPDKADELIRSCLNDNEELFELLAERSCLQSGQICPDACIAFMKTREVWTGIIIAISNKE